MHRTLFLLPLLAFPLFAGEDRAKVALALAQMKKTWPDLPEGMKWYTKTRHSQYLSINNGLDSNDLYRLDQDDTLFGRVNPNRVFPWAVSGGLHESSGWKSKAAVSIPEKAKVYVWTERVEAGARRPLPKYRWEWPKGTVFADVLSTDAGVFEVRTLTKTGDSWKARTEYKDPEKAPKGYTGPRKSCFDCHSEPITTNYGIQVRREDGIFSASPLVDGTLRLDTKNWPVEPWRE